MLYLTVFFCASHQPEESYKNHVDPTEGGDAQYDRQGAEDEEGGAGSSGGPGLGCSQRLSSWHDLH